MRICYSDRYMVPLPPAHPFPMPKYRMVRDRLLAEGAITYWHLIEPSLTRDEDILLVHTPDYWNACVRGVLTAHEIRRIGFPWSEGLVLPNGIGDEEYLAILREHVPRILDGFSPDFVFYQAGVDPFERDRLGKLRLTIGGLKRRDEFVISSCRERGIPVVTTMGGGYARDLNDTVEAHCNTVRVAFGFV